MVTSPRSLSAALASWTKRMGSARRRGAAHTGLRRVKRRARGLEFHEPRQCCQMRGLPACYLCTRIPAVRVVLAAIGGGHAYCCCCCCCYGWLVRPPGIATATAAAGTRLARQLVRPACGHAASWERRARDSVNQLAASSEMGRRSTSIRRLPVRMWLHA